MKLSNLNILFLLILFPISCYSQGLSAYVDHMGSFYVFDKGENIKVEDLEPQSFQVGAEAILYVSSAGHLKMYSQGNVIELERSGVSMYFATDHLLTYSIYEKLKVVHKGKVVDLSNRCTDYIASDSLVAFYDKNDESLKIFYKGIVTDIESGMIGFPVKIVGEGNRLWDAADNIIAYISLRNSDFKIWYGGELYTIERNVENTSFLAGRDIVAYIDILEQNFKAFYRGESYVLDDFIPISYKVGDEFVAFVSQTGEFKIFTDGEVKMVSSFEPQGYLVEDKVLAFIEDDYFKVWYNGEVIEIEAYVPTVYKLDWNTVAYLDQSNRLWLYCKGEKEYLANEFVNSYEIYRDLIQMNVKVNRNMVYYQDKFYEGLSYFK